MKLNKFNTIIVAAGRGTRFKHSTPKQFIKIGTDNIIDININQFLSHKLCDSVIVVLNKDFQKYYDRNKIKNRKLKFVIGRSTRQGSVLEGLKEIPKNNNSLIIHDAARPGIDHEIIDKLIKGLTKNVSCVIPILPLYDSILKKNKSDLDTSKSIKRKNLYRIQTPQIFRNNALSLRNLNINDEITDESEIIRKEKKNIKTIDGNERLLKITTLWDYKILKNILEKEKVYKVGNGFDVHKFSKQTGKQLFLGGVPIEHHHGLIGHSDADVLLHSITDAILGSISNGDIGSHFPPNNPKWKDIDSSFFLNKSIEMLKKKKGKLINIDVTVICETPKILNYQDKIIKNISNITKLSVDDISIKATTTEGLGFIGRNEGIAVMSNVMIYI